MIQDPRHVGHRIEWEMVATLPREASLRYMFVSQPPTTSLQLWGRIGMRGDEVPRGGVVRHSGGARVGHLVELMEEFGEGAFVMAVGSGEWERW